MDTVKARDLETQLRGKSIEKWEIKRLIDYGKSAAVFEASDSVAIKIFDDDLIKRYGDETQLKRIDRELSLVGKPHPNLVSILSGGVDKITNNHYIVMEYVDGPNMKSCLGEIPMEIVPSLLGQLSEAARFLERQGFAHRDIKPANIILKERYTKLVLLDLGVLRPSAGSDLTDADGIQSFVGTLQYSSPEFLLRTEEDSEEGWRALTFYQMGGVLHDLVMRKPLFAEFAEPYARLVNAVQHVTPEIQSSSVPAKLVNLARLCLIKDPKNRLRHVSWNSFQENFSEPAHCQLFKENVTIKTAILKAKMAESDAQVLDGLAADELTDEVIEYIKFHTGLSPGRRLRHALIRENHPLRCAKHNP